MRPVASYNAAMRFQQFPPPACLKEHIRYFWLLESADDGPAPRNFRTIADGCPGLILQQVEDERFRDQANKELPRIFLYGQATGSGEIYAGGAFRAMGVYLQPSALAAVFGLKADELTNSCVDLDLLAPAQAPRLSERLLAPGSAADQIDVLSAYLMAEIQKNKTPVDHGIGYSVAKIIESEGGASLEHLQARLGMSERTFQRRFKQRVGVPPKLFARICRFQASLNQLRHGRYGKLSDVAFENDYADQSHHIRAFQEFAGFSPQQYQKRANEVVENFPELIR